MDESFLIDFSLVASIQNDEPQVIIDISGMEPYQEFLTFTKLEDDSYTFMVDGDDLEGTQWQHESKPYPKLQMAIAEAFLYLATTPLEERIG